MYSFDLIYVQAWSRPYICTVLTLYMCRHGVSSGSRPTNATYGSRSTFLKTSNVNQLSQLKAENVHIC